MLGREKMIKRFLQSAKTKPIRTSKFTNLIYTVFPDSIEIKEVYNYGELPFLDKSEIAAVIFDVHLKKPIAFIVEFDSNNEIVDIKPFDDSSKKNLKELSEKYGKDFENLIQLHINSFRYKDRIIEIISALAEMLGKKITKFASSEDIYNFLIKEELFEFLHFANILAFGGVEDIENFEENKRKIFDVFNLLEKENLISTEIVD